MSATSVACAGCGRPTDAVEPPAEFARWAGLVPVRCADCLEAMAVEERMRERGLRAMARATRLGRVGVPPHLRGYSFGDIDRPEGLEGALRLARRWADGEVVGVGLLGPVGVGKSRVSVAAANEACARVQAHWYSAPVLVARMNGTFGSRERDEAERTQLGTRPLVLDDLDKVRPTEFAAEVLFKAIDARADGGGQLLVTTNLNGGELARRWPQPYGEALTSRLQLLTWLRVAGEDKRNGGGR